MSENEIEEIVFSPFGAEQVPNFLIVDLHVRDLHIERDPLVLVLNSRNDGREREGECDRQTDKQTNRY